MLEDYLIPIICVFISLIRGKYCKSNPTVLHTQQNSFRRATFIFCLAFFLVYLLKWSEILQINSAYLHILQSIHIFIQLIHHLFPTKRKWLLCFIITCLAFVDDLVKYPSVWHRPGDTRIFWMIGSKIHWLISSMQVIICTERTVKIDAFRHPSPNWIDNIVCWVFWWNCWWEQRFLTFWGWRGFESKVSAKRLQLLTTEEQKGWTKDFEDFDWNLVS